MPRAMREHPWGSNPLGEPSSWPTALRTAVSILLRSRYPMILTWGPEFVMLYNDAYIPTLGAKHPASLGGRLSVEFAEIWQAIGPMQTAVLMGAPATWDEDLALAIERGRGPEETFFTFSYSPVPDGERPGGVLAVLSDTTDQVVGARRLEVLRSVGSLLAAEMGSVAEQVAAALGAWPSELPSGRVRLPGPDGWGAVAEFGDPPPADACVSTDQERVAPLTRPVGDRPVRLTFETSAGRGLLEVHLPPMRRYDDDHRHFLDQLVTLVGQQVQMALAREQEAERSAALAALVQARTLFLSTMSHELRTPLTLVLGPLRDALAAARPLGPTEVEAVHRQALRLLGMVEDLLEVSRSESGQVPLNPVPVDLVDYTSRLVAPLAEAARRAGLDFVEDYRGSGGALVDTRRWDNIVLNLVGNAVKYTLHGRVEVRLELSEELLLSVRDTGIGIPSEQHTAVFERFHRVRTEAGRTIEGAGVGLAIVADAVAATRGTLALESEVGVGTTITVRMPWTRADADTDVRPSPQQMAVTEARSAELVSAPSPGQTVPGTGDGEGPLILVVDDHPAMREYVASCLACVGRTLLAKDGQDALQLLQRHRVDLVVSDVMMPHLDGSGLLEAIRTSTQWADLPVILLSARAGSSEVVEGMLGGADDYIPKPFSRDELVARVEAHLELVRLRRETQRRRDRESMLAGVSHDMQTPVARLASSLELLGSLDLPREAGQVTRLMSRSVHELRRLVTEFLDWSALALGQSLAPRLEPVDPAELLRGLPVDQQVAVTVVGAQDLVVLAEADRLRRILQNLVENAARCGASSVRVLLEARAGAGILRVEDDGPGVAREMRDELFEPWKTSHIGVGTGLGLFVSRESARAMGGDLRLVDSASGAAFEIELIRQEVP